MKLRLLVFPLLLVCALSAHAQYDINGAAFGAFTKSTSGNGLTQSQSDAVGFNGGLRRYVSPLYGWEATYSYNSARQDYGGTGYGFQSARQNTITGDWVISVPVSPTIRPFALIGGGAILFVPVHGVALATSFRGVINYGVGVDVALLPHLGVRAQYRGLFYRAPDFGQPAFSTDSYTPQSEPMAGIYYKF
jgi:opacity protein-like surface antigen